MTSTKPNHRGPASLTFASIESVHVRLGEESDVEAVREIFRDVYASDYPYQHFFDESWLRRSVYSDNIILLVAEDRATGRLLGTASIVLDVGSHTDLIGEFGRLAVRPEAQGRGVGRLLMKARVRAAAPRLHVALVEARTVHPYSQRIALANGFLPVGYLPQKHELSEPESVVLCARYFADALDLRKNNPRSIPEVRPLAHQVLTSLGLVDDVVVDENEQAYPEGGEFRMAALTEGGVSPLLRIERGRTRRREVFGPTTLQQGFFKIAATKSEYLLARGLSGEVAGAVGFLHDEREHSLRIFELVFSDESAARQLLGVVLEQVQKRGVRYVEIDVSANAPRLQRTLLELGFVPCAYIPAMVFAAVERLDVVRFAWLTTGTAALSAQLEAPALAISEHVISEFAKSYVLPKLRSAFASLAPFEGLTAEQSQRIANACRLRYFALGQKLFEQGEKAEGLFVILHGSVLVERDSRTMGHVREGELLGEFSAVSGEERSATALATTAVSTAYLERDVLLRLTRKRPDVGVVIYRNIALGLGRKLRSLDHSISQV